MRTVVEEIINSFLIFEVKNVLKQIKIV